MSQCTLALGLPVKYQDPGLMGLVPPLPELPDELVIDEGFPEKMRLGPVRANMYREGVDGATLVNYAVSTYREWVQQTEYLVLGKYDPLLGFIGFKAVKAAKRGNDVYNRRIRERFNEVMRLPNVNFFNYKDRSSKHTTRALFTTLTYDPGKLSIGEAWEAVGEHYNRFISGIRAKYGPVSVLRVWEAQKNGHPHIHMIMVFESAEFNAFHYNGAWRVAEKHDIEGSWEHGFSDVEALASLRGGLAYIAKYLGKVHGLSGGASSDEVEDSGLSSLVSRGSLYTLGLMWIFRKRAFSVSGSWCDLIRAMHNSNSDVSYWELVQVDLGGGAPAEAIQRWILLGFWSGELYTGARMRWSVGLTLSELREIQGSSCWSENPHMVPGSGRVPMVAGGLHGRR